MLAHQREVRERSEIRLEAVGHQMGIPDLVVEDFRRSHVACGAEDHDPVSGFPARDGRTRPHDHPRPIRAEDMVIQIVLGVVRGIFGVFPNIVEAGGRLEQGRPYVVEIQGGGHDGHKHLVGADFRERHLFKMQRAARILLRKAQALKQARFIAMDGQRPHRIGQGGIGEVVWNAALRLRKVEDVLQFWFHRQILLKGHIASKQRGRPYQRAYIRRDWAICPITSPRHFRR